MKWEYSILQLSPNPTLGDRISVGLVLINEAKTIIEYDEGKIKSLQKLFGLDIKLILRALKNFKVYFPERESNHVEFSEFKDCSNELEYLNTYLNGLLSATKPQGVELDISEVPGFVNSMLKIRPKKEKKIKQEYNLEIQKGLYNPLTDKVHININLDSQIIPNLYFNIHFDALGQNGDIMSAKYLDFDSTSETIIKHLTNMSAALDILEVYARTNKGKMFVIGVEPTSEDEEVEEIWRMINDNESMYKIVHPNEVGKITQEFNRRKSKKFLDFAV